MAVFNDGEAIELRNLFAGMDAGDEADAACTMNDAATFLQQYGLSFRQIVQQIEARGLPLPSKISAAIQLMDSTTLSEAESALAGARRLMRSCGLTFASIIDALEYEPTEADEFKQLKCAYRIEVERSNELEAELQILRARAAFSEFHMASTPFKNFVLVATFLFGLLLAVSIISTITDLFRSANATAALGGPATVRRADVAPRSMPVCWRDRSIQGPCF